MTPWLTYIVYFCMVWLTATMGMILYRMAKGPTIMDRILAFDTVVVTVVAMIALFSAMWKTSVYMDMILVFTFSGFFSSVAFMFYLHKTYRPHGDQEIKKWVDLERDGHHRESI